MAIADSIKKAKERGMPDDQILQEIIKQNPGKKPVFDEAIKRGVSSKQILEEILKQNAPLPGPTPNPTPVKTSPSPTINDDLAKKQLEEAKKRVEQLKNTLVKKSETAPPTPADTKPPIIKETLQAGVFTNSPETMQEPKSGVKELLERMKTPKKSQKSVPAGPTQKTNAIKDSPSPEISTPFPQKPSSGQKLWVRFAASAFIFVLVVGLATFWYWYLVIRVNPYPNPSPVTSAETTRTPSTTPTPVLEIPAALISIDTEKPAFEISDPSQVKPLLSQAIDEWQNTNEFERIVFVNKNTNKVLGLKDFFESTAIRAPEDLYSKVEDDFTLFIYSQAEGNRIGLVTKVIDPAGLRTVLTLEEKKMMSDFEPLFTIMGKDQNIPPLVPYFKNSSQIRQWKGPAFRYMTIKNNDLGILYLVSDDYLIFTSSIQNMKESISRLRLAGTKRGLTTDLKKGDTGFEVELLQTWLKEEGSTIYPEQMITGIFGSKTETAVKKFQEKYELDVLTPRGLSKGDGLIEQYTRLKLNELYADTGIIPPVHQITKELRQGGSGDEVRLLQTWLAKDNTIYPQKKITGWFGSLTFNAVKKFQERYKDEILTPQNLQQGSGIVDDLTRKKLNELYSGQ